mgnify:CR=1 FL=1
MREAANDALLKQGNQHGHRHNRDHQCGADQGPGKEYSPWYRAMPTGAVRIAALAFKDKASKTPWPFEERRGLRAYRHALSRGVPLYFTLQAQITRSRWYWFDEVAASATRKGFASSCRASSKASRRAAV